MNQHLIDVALGMLVGYAVARGLAHRPGNSPLRDGAAPMGEGARRPRPSEASSTPHPGALYPGGSSVDAPTPRF